MFGIFTAPESWIALFTLMLLDIFVSVDHILFISYAMEKLPKGTQKKAIYSGFALAILLRLVLLFSITLLLSLKKTIFITRYGMDFRQRKRAKRFTFHGRIVSTVQRNKGAHRKNRG